MHVAHHRLRAEADRQPGDSGAGEHRRDIHTELIERHQHGETADGKRRHVAHERSQRARALGALERVEAGALAHLVLEAAHQQPRRADQRIGEQSDQQDLEAVREAPLGDGPDPHAGARPQTRQLEGGEQQQRSAQDERRDAEKADRSTDERARERQVIADERQQAAPREPSGDERRQPGDDERRNHGQQHRVQVHGPLEEAWHHAVQDSRCAGWDIAGRDVGRLQCCLEANGCLVIGSRGTVGLASHASRFSTTSMTPYMRTQWPGNVQT